MRVLAATAPRQVREKLKLAIGVPTTIALQHVAGRQTTSRITGAQEVGYVLADGRDAYFPLEVGAMIDELHLAPREPFVIAKYGPADWEVERVHPASSAPQNTAGAVSHTAPAVQSMANVPAPHPTPAPAPAGPVNGAGESHADIMARCYRKAVDLALATLADAESKGLRLPPPVFEDVRTMGTALFIQESGARR